MRNNLNRKIVVAVLAFFLAISVGYAIFSETITIEGTAKAQMQDEFDIDAICQTGKLDGYVATFNIPDEKGYKNDSCVVSGDKNKVSFNVEFTESNSARFFTVKLANVGTIDAMIELSALESGNTEYKQINICFDGYNGEINGNIEDEECYISSSAAGKYSVGYYGVVAVEESDGNLIYITNENQEAVIGKYAVVNNGMVYINMPPNASIYLMYHIKINSFGSGTELSRATFTYDYDFIQSIK